MNCCRWVEVEADQPRFDGTTMNKLSLAIAGASALGATALGHLYLERLEHEVSGGARVAVLVAAKDLPINAPLTEDAVAVRELPQAYLEGRHVRASDLKQILGTRLSGGLKANETILWTDLSKFNSHARVLSALVQNNMRAISIDPRSSTFDGLLRPGDRVDVVYTQGKTDAGGSTSTLLQNVLVLSVGGDISRADEQAKEQRGRGGAVTLSVTVEQAQLLTQARERGRLTLTLRNADDIAILSNIPETTGVAPLMASPAQSVSGKHTQEGTIEHVR